MKTKKILMLLGATLVLLALLISGCEKPDEPRVPTLTTAAVSAITTTTATSGGNITSDGDATIIAHGVCWSITRNPTTADSKTTSGAGMGSFTNSITGLTANTTYYVCAYAKNSAGTGYGRQVSFKTLPLPIAVISVSPSSIDFGTMTVEQTLDRNVTISNSSSSTANLIGNVAISGSGFSIVSGSGSFSLSPDQSKTITVRFAPTSATSYSGSVSITHDATNQSSPATVSLSGTGQNVTLCTPILVSPSNGAVLDNGCSDHSDKMTWNFDWQDCASATTYHLYVKGENAIIPVIDDDNISSSEYAYDSYSYVGGENRFNWTWKVRAMVNDQWGPWSAERSFNVEPPDTDCATELIIISVSPFSINFASVTVGQTLDWNVTISNSSSSTANLIGNVAISGSGFSIVSGSGSFSLSPDQSKTIGVRFAPTSATSYSGSLSITHNATNQSSPATVSLSGSGQPAPARDARISVSATSIDFGTVTVGQTLNRNFTISNSSSSNSNISCTASFSGSGFSIFSGGLGGFWLSPGQSKSITFRFAPTSATSYSGSINIAHSATNTTSPITIPLSGKGESPPPGSPTLIFPANGTNTNAYVFRWSSPDNAYWYEIQVDNSISFSSPEIWEWSLTENYYKPSSKTLSEGMTYYWRVRAANSAGKWGNWSSTWKFTADYTATIKVTFDKIYVINDGDPFGKGELYWTFQWQNSSTSIAKQNQRTRDNPLSIEEGKTYYINDSYTFERENIDGNSFGIWFKFGEASPAIVIPDESLGEYSMAYGYNEATNDCWSTGFYSHRLGNLLFHTSAEVIVYWKIERID